MSYQRGVRPDYMVGTITLTAGETSFTVTDASLQTATVQGGDTIITADGRGLIIREVTDQNSGELFYPCPASAAGVDLPVHIRFQPSGSGLQAAIRDLIARWGQNGNVDAFAALEGFLGGVPVFSEFGMEVVAVDDLKIKDPHHNLAELAALAKAANQFVIMGADGSIILKPISELTDAIENNRLAIVGLKGGTSEQYTRGDGTHAAMNKAAVGLPHVEDIAPSDMPISTATSNALSGKWNLLGGNVFTGAQATNDGTIEINKVANHDGDVLLLKLGWSNAEHFFWGLDRGAKLCLWGYDWRGIYRGNPLVISNDGHVAIGGTLSKAGGTFDIDHPCDPFNKNLRHGFVESTEYLNLYRGLVTLENGRMDIDVDAAFGMSDGTFAALNADVMVTSLQNQNGFERICIQGDPSTGKFTIVCENENSTAVIAWMVSGRRKDAFVLHMDKNCERGTGRFIPEYDKEDA